MTASQVLSIAARVSMVLSGIAVLLGWWPESGQALLGVILVAGAFGR